MTILPLRISKTNGPGQIRISTNLELGVHLDELLHVRYALHLLLALQLLLILVHQTFDGLPDLPEVREQVLSKWRQKNDQTPWNMADVCI